MDSWVTFEEVAFASTAIPTCFPLHAQALSARYPSDEALGRLPPATSWLSAVLRRVDIARATEEARKQEALAVALAQAVSTTAVLGRDVEDCIQRELHPVNEVRRWDGLCAHCMCCCAWA